MLCGLSGSSINYFFMRILVVTQYFWPENFRINDLVSELIKKGHNVTILTGLPSYPNMEVYEKYIQDKIKYNSFNGAKIIRVPIVTRGNAGLKLILNYISFFLSASTIGVYKLRKLEFDSIFVFEPSPITVGIPAIILRRLKKAPLIFWVLDLWPETLEAVGIIKSKLILEAIGRIVSTIYKRCDLILGQSKSFISHIMRRSGNTRVEYFPGWAESILETKISNNIVNKNKVFNITFTGNIGKSQDFPSIISAIEILKNNNKIHWTIVGDGRYFKWLKREITEKKLNNRVTLAGRHPIENMPRFFNEADALLVSLKDEPIFSLTIPGKIQAYLSTGKPILGMLNGEGARILKESNSGLVCNSGDSKSLVQNINKLSNMSIHERFKIGLNGINLSSREFDRDILINKLESWMSELVSDNLIIK